MGQALAGSVNTVAARIAHIVGLERVADTAARLGVPGRIRPHPSLALGTHDMRLIDLTAAYAPFANGGHAAWPYGIVEIMDGDGNKRAAETEMVTTHNPMSSHHTLSSAEWSEKRRSSSVVSTSGKWQTMKDANGDKYYYCAATNATQWERPRGLLNASESTVTNY